MRVPVLDDAIDVAARHAGTRPAPCEACGVTSRRNPRADLQTLIDRRLSARVCTGHV